MANRSMMFRPPLKNFHLLGDALKRSTYSSENHVMHTASTMASWGLSWKLPFSSFTCMLGIVFRVSAIVDRTMNRIEMIAITCKSNERPPQG